MEWKFLFGIEIEAVGSSKYVEETGRPEGYHRYDRHESKGNYLDSWIREYDASISYSRVEGEAGYEFISLPFRPQHARSVLKELFDNLKEHGDEEGKGAIYINKSCGLHIHFSASPNDPNEETDHLTYKQMNGLRKRYSNLVGRQLYELEDVKKVSAMMNEAAQSVLGDERYEKWLAIKNERTQGQYALNLESRGDWVSAYLFEHGAELHATNNTIEYRAGHLMLFENYDEITTFIEKCVEGIETIYREKLDKSYDKETKFFSSKVRKTINNENNDEAIILKKMKREYGDRISSTQENKTLKIDIRKDENEKTNQFAELKNILLFKSHKNNELKELLTKMVEVN